MVRSVNSQLPAAAGPSPSLLSQSAPPLLKRRRLAAASTPLATEPDAVPQTPVLQAASPNPEPATRRCYVCGKIVKTGFRVVTQPDCPHVACSLAHLQTLTMQWIDIKAEARELDAAWTKLPEAAPLKSAPAPQPSSPPPAPALGTPPSPSPERLQSSHCSAAAAAAERRAAAQPKSTMADWRRERRRAARASASLSTATPDLAAPTRNLVEVPAAAPPGGSALRFLVNAGDLPASATEADVFAYIASPCPLPGIEISLSLIHI